MKTIKRFISVLLLAFAAHTASAQVQHRLTVVLAGAPAGAKVVSSPVGIDCPTRGCSALFNQTISFPFPSGIIRLTATVPQGYSVTWSANVTATQNPNVVDVFLMAPLTVTATFTPTAQLLPLTVTLAGTGTGQVTSNPNGIFCTGGGGNRDCDESYPPATPPTQVTLTAAAHPGALFTGWSGACSGTGTCVVTMDQARNVTATFDLILELPIIDAAPIDGSFCAGESVMLAVLAHAQSGAPLTYQWRRQTGVIFEAIPSATEPEYLAMEAGRYDVVVTITGAGSRSTPPQGASVVENASPVAQPDFLLAVPGQPLVIPVAALLANDALPVGTTASVTSVAIPPGGTGTVSLKAGNTIIRFTSSLPAVQQEFHYQLAAGACTSTGVVQLSFRPSPVPAANQLLLVSLAPDHDSLALPFVAPASGDFVLERAPVGSAIFEWVELASSPLNGGEAIAFSDPWPPAAGAVYRIKRTSPSLP